MNEKILSHDNYIFYLRLFFFFSVVLSFRIPYVFNAQTFAFLRNFLSSISSHSFIEEVEMLTDAQISNRSSRQSITHIAAHFGLHPEEFTCFGSDKAKVKLSVLQRTKSNHKGKLIAVTAVTPTAFGEGKTVTSIGLTQSLHALGYKVAACLRQPSLGPVFGTKGGAAGGGYAQVVPMEALNLHLTGDIHAISSAHNLAAAAIEARLYHEKRLGAKAFEAQTGLTALDIDAQKIKWHRVMDHNDRGLRQIEVGLGGHFNGEQLPSSFDITAASELMAILALSQDLTDLRQRIGRIVLAMNQQGEAITAQDLGVAGAMTAIMRDTIEPTLMQTLNGAPCLIHTGPFANIAHGNSSIIADHIALKLSDFVVTEGGFGSDMGFEKFCHIKTPVADHLPDCAVLVVTLRALKSNATVNAVTTDLISSPNQAALEEGAENLRWHLEHVQKYKIPVIVAINRFPEDTQAELDWVHEFALQHGASGCEISEAFSRGVDGGTSLAKAVVDVLNQQVKSQFEPLYDPKNGLLESLVALATKCYGAADVQLSSQAQLELEEIKRLGFGHLPICMAKTPMSISHDPLLKGAPSGFILEVQSLRLNAGAGFVTALLGKVMTMPGLSAKPNYLNIDIDELGQIVGLD